MSKGHRGNTISPNLTDKQFGNVRKIKGSNKLYLDFRYFGRRVRMATGYEATPQNVERLKDVLKGIGRRIRNNSFVFAEAFPNADPKLKEYFNEMEGSGYTPRPEEVLFAEFADNFMKKHNETTNNKDLLVSYNQHYSSFIRPFFKNLVFTKITSGIMEDFISSCKATRGANKGKLVSKSSLAKIFTVLRMLFDQACEKYNWNLPDPFRNKAKKVKKIYSNEVKSSEVKKRRDVFTYDEWEKVLSEIPTFYQPVANVMIMTGMIASEIRGLRKIDIEETQISIRNTVDKHGNFSDKMKTEYRERDFPLTEALKENLEKAMISSPSEFVFTNEDGSPFNSNTFFKNIWKKAFEKSGVSYRVPYATRHSLVAWALVIGAHPDRVVELMGHANRTMIFTIYGKYREGLINDRRKILEYFGIDFLATEEQHLVGLLKYEI